MVWPDSPQTSISRSACLASPIRLRRPLSLLALASEEDALRLWATLPSTNPVNSSRVINTEAYVSETQQFSLSQRYHWDNVGGGGVFVPMAVGAGRASVRLQTLMSRCGSRPIPQARLTT